MSEKAENRLKAPRLWGLTANAVLNRWQGHNVSVEFANGKTLAGGLVGYDDYTYTLLLAEKAVVVVNKGHVAIIRATRAREG